MRLFIEPSDVLLFRDGKPFSAGDDHNARSIFPPSPRTFQGAIRAAILSRYGFDAAAAKPVIGDSDSYGKINRMLGPFIASSSAKGDITEFLPLPLDLGRPKSDKGKDVIIPIQPCSETRFKSDLEGICLPWAKTAARLTSYPSYLPVHVIYDYLAGKLPSTDAIVAGEKVFSYELRTGIRRSHLRHAAEEGQLYSVSFVRMNAGFGFTYEFTYEIEGVDDKPPKSGLLVLGGEARPAMYRRIEDRASMPRELVTTIEASISKSQRFKLYIATPAIFSRGWLPARIDPATGYKGNLNGIPVRLVSAVVGRPIPIGGWELRPGDADRERPRPIQRAVPAGSIYWFETDAKPESVIEKLHFQCISDSDNDRKIGFGLSLIGGC